MPSRHVGQGNLQLAGMDACSKPTTVADTMNTTKQASGSDKELETWYIQRNDVTGKSCLFWDGLTY